MEVKSVFGLMVLLMVLCFVPGGGWAQLDTSAENLLVTRAEVETSDGLRVVARVDKTKYKRGENVSIHLVVSSKSRKPIYFVKKESPRIHNDRGDILVEAPTPLPEEKDDYDYSFHKIDNGRPYIETIVLPASLIEKQRSLDITVAIG